MTETQTFPSTVAPNGNTVTTLPAPDGWSVTAYRTPGSPVSKLVVVSPDRKRVLHREKVTDNDLLTVAAKMIGAVPPVAAPATQVADLVDQLSASIAAAKAAKKVA